jgi:threonine/homoserine/homoserine lactone efflux protein
MEPLATQAAQLWLFFGIVLGVVLLPGLDMTFVLAITIADGRRSGFAGVGGITAAGLCHVAAGAAGIAAIVALAPALFGALLLAGTIYLGWIGIQLLRNGSALPAGGGVDRRDGALALAFRRGMITNLLNPKAYAFMFAVFPQFVNAERGAIWVQAIPLWLIIAATQLAVYGAVVLAAGGARGWLVGHRRVLDLAGRGIGAFLLIAALASGLRGWHQLP